MDQFLLSQQQKHQVLERTDHYIELANQKLQLKLPSISVKFDLKGRTSGMFVVTRKQLCIRYNQIIFSAYYADSLKNTVAHEVAHYVVYSMCGSTRVKPHGEEWKQVMALYELEPLVTSRYDVSYLPLRRQQQHAYRCSCMSHQLSTTRHNKVQNRKVVYRCRKCSQPLKLDSHDVITD